MIDLSRLRETLGSPELRWVLDRIRARLERGEGVEHGHIRLGDARPSQREAVARLFGTPTPRGTGLTVSLPKLAALLRSAELCDNLAEAVEAVTGPVVNLKAIRQTQARQWDTLRKEAETRAGSRPAVVRWLSELNSSGLLRRLSGQDVGVARELLDQAFRLIDRLPARDVPLAELAADVAGDSHALDAGRPLGTIALRFAIAHAGTAANNGAENRREIWEVLGVLCDELSAPVLTLNLRAAGDTATAMAMRCHADTGEPYRLSTRQLIRQPTAFSLAATGPCVFVCENPTVLAAAANRLGAHCAPLVCIEGQPKSAARLLLSRIRSGGIDLLYHGDFDWDGVHIANLIMKRHGARPWRYATEDYCLATGGTVLDGSPVPADWDSRLAGTMQQQGRAIHEEQVLDTLLADLGPARTIVRLNL